jgi:hypothetical protein
MRREMYTEFRQKNLKESDHLGDVGVDRVILKQTLEKQDGARTRLPQDRDRWRSLVNAVRNLRVP